MYPQHKHTSVVSTLFHSCHQARLRLPYSVVCVCVWDTPGPTLSFIEQFHSFVLSSPSHTLQSACCGSLITPIFLFRASMWYFLSGDFIFPVMGLAAVKPLHHPCVYCVTSVMNVSHQILGKYQAYSSCIFKWGFVCQSLTYVDTKVCI